jgi:hypothetical protein
MRFVIVNHSYDEFLTWLYESNPSLARQPFAAQIDAYYATLFGSSDFWTHALRQLGHQVDEFIYNNVHAQRSWLCEHQPQRTKRSGAADWFFSPIKRSRQKTPEQLNFDKLSPFEVLLTQLNAIRPDVFYNQSIYAFDDDQLHALKVRSDLLIGEHAATPLPETIDYRLYDLIVSSFPPTVEWLRGRGARAELNLLAFDPRVGSMIPETPRDIGVSFAGSFLRIHQSRFALLEAVAAQVPEILVHGTVRIDVPPSSPLSGKIGTALWGRDMYALLRRSKITLNHHGDVLPFANNMRLYEATGMGCLLVTDYKDNLREIFEPEREVVTYRNAAECVDKIRFYLDDRNRCTREKIAAAGQKHTLHEHTYHNRMKHLVDLIKSL